MIVERLIAAGHAGAIHYTPRQAAAFAKLANERQRSEAAAQFSTVRAAYHADEQKANRFLRALGVKKKG